MQNKYSKKYFEGYAFNSLALCYDKRLIDICCDAVKDESPDFQIETLYLGIEVTEAITNIQGEQRFIINQYFGEGLSAKKIIKDSTRRFGKKIKGKIHSIDGIAAYSENPSLYDTSIHLDKLCESIRLKTKKLNENYKLFKENWLYVFSGTGLLKVDDIDIMQAELHSLISQYQNQFNKIFINCFDTIFIIDKTCDVASSICIDNDTLARIKRQALE